MGKRQKRQNLELLCENCKANFFRKVSVDQKLPKHVYCSVKCKREDKNSYISEWTDERRISLSAKVSGENNPNYGNNWSDSQKQHLSKLKIKLYEDHPEIAYECGKSNRGVKFDQARIDAMHAHRTKESYQHYPDEDTRRLIGQKSSEKWTEEFRKKYRGRMEELGHWVKLDEIEPCKLYKKESNWIDSMVEFFSDTELKNLNEYGIFNPKCNSKGFVRDHIVPRIVGFEFNIPPFIIRHPANLQFISHRDNVKKGFEDRKMTLEEKISCINLLFERIQEFSIYWTEQETCTNYIKERRCV